MFFLQLSIFFSFYGFVWTMSLNNTLTNNVIWSFINNLFMKSWTLVFLWLICIEHKFIQLYCIHWLDLCVEQSHCCKKTGLVRYSTNTPIKNIYIFNHNNYLLSLNTLIPYHVIKTDLLIVLIQITPFCLTTGRQTRSVKYTYIIIHTTI